MHQACCLISAVHTDLKVQYCRGSLVDALGLLIPHKLLDLLHAVIQPLHILPLVDLLQAGYVEPSVHPHSHVHRDQALQVMRNSVRFVINAKWSNTMQTLQW